MDPLVLRIGTQDAAVSPLRALLVGDLMRVAHRQVFVLVKVDADIGIGRVEELTAEVCGPQDADLHGAVRVGSATRLPCVPFLACAPSWQPSH